MGSRFSTLRHQRDRLSYERESRMAARLDDQERVAQLREMYVLYLSLQRSKTAAELAAEARAERRLNAWNLNPRYRSLLEEAHAAGDAC